MAMPDPADEIRLIETFSPTRVIGLTLNHEHMDESQVASAIDAYTRDLGVPVTDALTRPAQYLVDMVFAAFPELAVRSQGETQ